MNKIHIVAGALAFFFLAVAIAKSIAQAVRKNKARKESVARSQADNISLHDPYPGEAPADEAESAAAPADNAPAAPGGAPAPQPPAPVPPQPEQEQPREQIYKWN